MPAPRGVKRTASKSSAVTVASSAPKNKKKRGVTQLEIPTRPTKRGSVLTCGQGDVGQLGLGEDVMELTKFKLVPDLSDKIVAVCAGGMHTVALDKDGVVWTFGCNDEGALGRTGEESKPAPVSLPDKVTVVSAGDSHTAALSDTGKLYAWGSFRDSHGSMGLIMSGGTGKACQTPVLIELPEPVAHIASGSDHLVVCTISGAVYTMGCGEQGQLGRLSQRSASREARQGFSALLTPGKVTIKATIVRVWAGYHATFALSDAGKLLAWGLNNYSQLGISGEKRKCAIYSPTECDALKSLEGWQSVAIGQHHSILLAAGRVYALGRSEYGRLGLGDREGDAETPELIPNLDRCISIACGTSNSFAVTDSGAVYAWGMGSEGQLGTGSDSDVTVPTRVTVNVTSSHVCVCVAAGGQHATLCTEDTSKTTSPSPVPEQEAAEQKTEQKSETEPKKEKKTSKRQKKQELEEAEVSSTSTAEVTAVKPQKVNGNEKETAMEVDETDATKTDSEKPSAEKDTPDKPATEETKPAKEEKKPATEENNKMDAKPVESESTDAEMKDATELNGVPETEKKPENATELATEKSVPATEKSASATEKSESIDEVAVTA